MDHVRMIFALSQTNEVIFAFTAGLFLAFAMFKSFRS